MSQVMRNNVMDALTFFIVLPGAFVWLMRLARSYDPQDSLLNLHRIGAVLIVWFIYLLGRLR